MAPDLAVTAPDGSCNVAMCPAYRRTDRLHDPLAHREQDARHDKAQGFTTSPFTKRAASKSLPVNDYTGRIK